MRIGVLRAAPARRLAAHWQERQGVVDAGRHERRAASRARAADRAVAVACWLGFVWLTNRWYSWGRTIELLFGSDMAEYERIARAAPGLPTVALPSQHADRFVPHYLVGLLSDGLGLDLHTTYRIAAAVLLVAVIVVVDLTIAPFGLALAEYALCIGALVANPYLFRFLVIAPARLADSVFVLGGALALLGLLRLRSSLAVGGLVLATLGRSEAVLPLVVLAPLGVALSPSWRRRSTRSRRTTAVLAVAAPVAVYAVLRVVDSGFSVADHPGFLGLTIFGSLASLPGSAGHIALHLVRTLVGLAPVMGLLAGLALARLRGSRAPALGFATWAAVAAGVAVSGEALILNPTWLDGSEPLLSALGSASFVVAAALAFASGDRARRPLGPATVAIATAGLALASLHHRFARFSPAHTPAAYAALAIVGLLLAAAALAVRAADAAPGRG